MKKLAVALPFALVALFVLLWNIATQHIIADTKRWLDQVQENKNIVISYDKITSTGFPFRVGASIEGLKVKVKTGQLISSPPQPLAATDLQINSLKGQFNTLWPLLIKDLPQNDVATLLTLEHEAQYSSAVSITSNLLANNIQVTFGDVKFTSKDNSGENVFYAKGETLYTLEFNRTDTLTLLTKKFRLIDPASFSINNVKLISIEAKDSKLTGKDQDKIMVSAKDLLYKIEHLKSENNNNIHDDIHLVIREKDAIVTKEFNSVLGELQSYKIIFKAFNQDIPEFKNTTTQNIDIDVNVALPDVKNKGGVVINKFELLSNVWNFSALGKSTFSWDQSNNFSMDQLSLHGYTQFTAEAYQQSIDEIATKSLKKIQAKFPNAKNISLDDIKLIMPRIHEFGKIEFDLEAMGDAQNIKIDNLRISSDPYSMSLKLAASNNKTPAMKGDMNIVVRNHKQLIHDAINYYHNILTLLNSMNIGSSKKIEFKKDLEEKTVDFVNSIADSQSTRPDEISVTIKYDANGLVSVGKLSKDQVNERLKSLAAEIEPTTTSSTVNYTTSLQQLEDKAKSGDANAQYNLASMYFQGQGAPLDYAKAYRWFGAAAIQDHPEASNNIGIMLAQGKGVKKDLKRANIWFSIANRKGSQFAKTNLANLSLQRGYAALITALPQGITITCEKYDHQAIDNLLITNLELGNRSVHLIEPGKPDSIPQSLRAYTRQQAKAVGVIISE